MINQAFSVWQEISPALKYVTPADVRHHAAELFRPTDGGGNIIQRHEYEMLRDNSHEIARLHNEESDYREAEALYEDRIDAEGRAMNEYGNDLDEGNV